MIYNCDFNSTMLQSATYNDETNELTVVFSNGKEYTYEEVSINTFMDLRDEPSAGGYFNKIKGKLKGKIDGK